MDGSADSARDDGIREARPQMTEAAPPVKGDVDEDVISVQTDKAGSPSAGKELALPSWSAPVGLPLVFATIAAYLSYKETSAVSPALAFGAAVFGLMVGTVVWVCDRPSGRGGRLDVSDQGTMPGRFLALASLFISCIPFLGAIISGWAVFTNRRRTAGWPRAVSQFAFALALLWSAVCTVLILLSGPKR
jgi:hypothetical protein